MVSSGFSSGSGLNSQYLSALLVCPLCPILWSGNSSTAGQSSGSLYVAWKAQVFGPQYEDANYIFNVGTVTARPRRFRTEYPYCNSYIAPLTMQDLAPASALLLNDGSKSHRYDIIYVVV